MIDAEVVYAESGRQLMYAVSLADGASVEDAIRASGLGNDFPGLDIACCRVGIHGKLVTRATPIRSGDRVEIYRDLIADPKEARRRRAAK